MAVMKIWRSGVAGVVSSADGARPGVAARRVNATMAGEVFTAGEVASLGGGGVIG